MKLTHLLNKRIIIARLAVLTGDKMAFSTVTVEMMNIQPRADSKSELRPGLFGKEFRAYMDGDVDIDEGDRLRDENNNYYTVKSDGVSRRTMGSFDYLIVALEKTK